MAVLTTQQQHNLPSSTFAGPGRSFPIPDKNHAKAALSLVGRAEAHGSITPSEAAHIHSVAHRKLMGKMLKAKK